MTESSQSLESLKATHENLHKFALKSTDRDVQRTFHEAALMTEKMITNLKEKREESD